MLHGTHAKERMRRENVSNQRRKTLRLIARLLSPSSDSSCTLADNIRKREGCKQISEVPRYLTFGMGEIAARSISRYELGEQMDYSFTAI